VRPDKYRAAAALKVYTLNIAHPKWIATNDILGEEHIDEPRF
jgi:hypothetical protein